MIEHADVDIDAPPRTQAHGRAYATAGAMAAIVIVLDQITKAWAVRTLTEDTARHVVWTLRWKLFFNSGMAFSQGLGKGPLISVLALVIVGVLLLSLRQTHSALGIVGVGLVVGGALGNVLDRITRASNGFLSGNVVDFIDFQWWPAFNVADMGVVIGAAILIFESWRRSRGRTHHS